MTWILAIILIYVMIAGICIAVSISQGNKESQKRQAMQDEIRNSELTKKLLVAIKQNESEISEIDFDYDGIRIGKIYKYIVPKDTKRFTYDEMMYLRDLCYNVLDSSKFEKYDNSEYDIYRIRKKEIIRTKNPFS